MTYEVHVERSVEKSLRRLDRKASDRIRVAMANLADEPRPHGAKALTGQYTGYLRLRVSAPGGEYRIVYEVDDRAGLVTVIEAGPREGAY